MRIFLMIYSYHIFLIYLYTYFYIYHQPCLLIDFILVYLFHFYVGLCSHSLLLWASHNPKLLYSVVSSFVKSARFWICSSFFRLYCCLPVAYELQIGPDMLISGFLQPIPDITPAIPSMEETSLIDPTVTPYESNIILFYKTWDPYGAFSNFSPHPIQMTDESGDYLSWPSVEHYYQVIC